MSEIVPRKSDTETELADAGVEFWTNFERMFQDFQDDFHHVFGSPFLVRATDARPALAPALTDVVDRGDAFEVQADLPGMAKEQVDVRAVGRSIRIRAESKKQVEEKGRNILRRERGWVGYERIIELPEPVRSDGIQAKLENGVLTITVPKARPVVERTVTVQ